MEMYYIRGAWRTYDTRPRRRQCVLSHRSSSSNSIPEAHAKHNEHARHGIAIGSSSSERDIPVRSKIYTTRFREAKVFYRSFVSGPWISESSSEVVLKCDTCHYVAVIDAGQGGDGRVITAQNTIRFAYSELKSLLDAYCERRRAGIMPIRIAIDGKTLSMDYVDPDNNQVCACTVLSESAVSIFRLKSMRLPNVDGEASAVDPETLYDMAELDEDSDDSIVKDADVRDVNKNPALRCGRVGEDV